MVKYENLLGQQIDNADIVLYNVVDIQSIFKIGRTQAYRLMNTRGFPAIKLNNRLYVPREKLRDWINKYTGKNFIY